MHNVGLTFTRPRQARPHTAYLSLSGAPFSYSPVSICVLVGAFVACA